MKAQVQMKNVLAILEDMKVSDITSIDVRKKTSITDYIVIATARSGRHAKAAAQKLVDNMRDKGVKPFGIEGMNTAEWVLIDLSDIVVHIMQREARSLYNLEQLWLTEARITEK